MPLFKRSLPIRPNPQDCTHAQWSYVEGHQTVTRVHTGPDKTSQAYQDTVRTNYGLFQAADYLERGGEMRTTSYDEVVAVATGNFTCRRLVDRQPAEVTAEAPAVRLARDGLEKKLGAMGLCNGCEYFDKTAVEADMLDAERFTAAAELAQAKLSYARALRELEDFHGGSTTPAIGGGLPDFPPATEQ